MIQNGVSVTIKRYRIDLMVLMCIIVKTVVETLSQSNCPDCGCDVDDHKGNFCMNCGEQCELDE